MIKKNTLIFFAVIVVSFVVLNVFYDKYLDKQARKNYVAIYNTALNGKLSYLSVSAGSTYIRISEGEDKYAFIPHNITPGENQIFYTLARIGDSVIKHEKSDTITLITADKKSHQFTFSKPVR